MGKESNQLVSRILGYRKNFCAVPFISNLLRTIVHLEIGGKLKDEMKATAMEMHLTKKGLEKLSKDRFFW
jgi:hypothetical protein